MIGEYPMREINPSIANIAEPLINSKPFHRLHSVTFLGILSPRFAYLPDHPLSQKKDTKARLLRDDATRADHSIAVANIVLAFCDRFSLAEQTRRYAIAWALLHDIATWPLSHTSEAAFTRITGLTHKALRHKLIIGDPSLPKDYTLVNAIREMGIDPNQVLFLFDKNTKPQDSCLSLLYSFIHSAITPDTLEGISRSRHALGVDVLPPSDVLGSFERDLLNTMILRKHSRPVLKFLRDKKEIYEKYINTRQAIEYESRWTDAILQLFGSFSLIESLELTEDEVVAQVSQLGLQDFRSVGRYKAPRQYIIDKALAKKRILPKDQRLEDLDQFFHSRRK